VAKRNTASKPLSYVKNGRSNNVVEVHRIGGVEHRRKVRYITDDFGMLHMFFVTEHGHSAHWGADAETEVIKALGVTLWSEHVDKSIPKYQFVRYEHEERT
jgi:hypothetical protein